MKFTIINSDAERREGLKALLRHIDRHAHFSDGQDWRQGRQTVERISPDLIVIDWQSAMRVNDLRELLERCPGIPAAVIVDDAAAPEVRRLLVAGALGVVPRALDPRVLVRVLEIVLLGGRYVPVDALAPGLPSEFAPRNPPAPVTRKPNARRMASLSKRQQQIMRCVHMGNTNKVIAKTLGISEGTVKIHLTSIFQQLGASNRAAAVAIYNGWQNGYLQVLRRESEAETRPALGEPGPRPLRKLAAQVYPSVADNDDAALPLAAEPANTFGK